MPIVDFQKWKYGLIKVAEPTTEQRVCGVTEDICELVELYQDEGGEYTSYCTARVQTLSELRKAWEDASKDGVNTTFYDSGVFQWEPDYSHMAWKYTPNDPLSYKEKNFFSDSDSDSDESALYREYGGD